MTETRLRPTVGVTIGDPAGIGPEIVVRALAEDAARQSLDVVVIGDRWVLQRAMGATGVGVEFVAEGSPRLIDLANVDHRLQWGKVQATAGAAAGQFIERGVQEALAGRVDALATAPISKEALWRAGYRYPGHTEMLGALTGRSDPLTMFQVRNLRIFFLTRHLSLREAVDQVTRSRIAAKTVDFHGAVSVTLGLPFIRTSVDHGTAFDIAGQGVARADSMAAAILAAADLTRRVRAAAR